MKTANLETIQVSGRDIYQKIYDNIQMVMKGQSETIRKLLSAFISGGHVLLDDYPGTGKTTLLEAFLRGSALLTGHVLLDRLADPGVDDPLRARDRGGEQRPEQQQMAQPGHHHHLLPDPFDWVFAGGAPRRQKICGSISSR